MSIHLFYDYLKVYQNFFFFFVQLNFFCDNFAQFEIYSRISKIFFPRKTKKLRQNSIALEMNFKPLSIFQRDKIKIK